MDSSDIQHVLREEERWRLGQEHTATKVAERAALGRAQVSNGHPPRPLSEFKRGRVFCPECRRPHEKGTPHPLQVGWWLE